MKASFLVACASLAPSGFAATLQNNDVVMRREANDLHVKSTGELLKASNLTHEPHTCPGGAGDDPYCDIAFVLGKEGTNDCEDPDNHCPINNGADCAEAAARSGAFAIHGKFQIKGDHQNLHPLGCFKDKCHESPNGVCYFFNSKGSPPTGTAPGWRVDMELAGEGEGEGQMEKCDIGGQNPDGTCRLIGTPICKRAKTVQGTQDKQGECLFKQVDGAGSGALTGDDKYKYIDNQEKCLEQAACWGKELGHPFIIGEDAARNASKHLDYPTGCFINNEDGKAYWNPTTAMESLRTTPDTRLRGTSICIIKEIVDFRSNERLDALENATTSEHTRAADAAAGEHEGTDVPAAEKPAVAGTTGTTGGF